MSGSYCTFEKIRRDVYKEEGTEAWIERWMEEWMEGGRDGGTVVLFKAFFKCILLSIDLYETLSK